MHFAAAEFSPGQPDVLICDNMLITIYHFTHMDHSIVFQKGLAAWQKSSNLIEHFEKFHRYALGLRWENQCLELVEEIIAAETLPEVMKASALSRAIVKADVCAVLSRFALEKKLIVETNYFILAGLFQEIAKMCTKWRSSLR
jgi:hypothetical protein